MKESLKLYIIRKHTIKSNIHIFNVETENIKWLEQEKLNFLKLIFKLCLICGDILVKQSRKFKENRFFFSEIRKRVMREPSSHHAQ